MLQKLGRIAGTALQFGSDCSHFEVSAADPPHIFGILCTASARPRLPVPRGAFRDCGSALRSGCHRGPIRGGMQRLVAVDLGNGNVVLNLPAPACRANTGRRAPCSRSGYHAPPPGSRRCRAPARTEKPFVLHLAVDGIQALLPAEHLCRNAGINHLAVDVVENARQQLSTVACAEQNGTRQNLGTQRMNELKGKILQFR